ELGERALARVAAVIGSGLYPPRRERVARLRAGLAAAPERARTLGGCRFVAWRGRVLGMREAARAGPPGRPVPREAGRGGGPFRRRRGPRRRIAARARRPRRRRGGDAARRRRDRYAIAAARLSGLAGIMGRGRAGGGAASRLSSPRRRHSADPGIPPGDPVIQ